MNEPAAPEYKRIILPFDEFTIKSDGAEAGSVELDAVWQHEDDAAQDALAHIAWHGGGKGVCRARRKPPARRPAR